LGRGEGRLLLSRWKRHEDSICAASTLTYSIEYIDPSLILRSKEDYDGAEPSPNSFALESLTRLHNLLHKDSYKTKAHKLVDAFSSHLSESPYAMPHMASAFAGLAQPARQIVIAGSFGQATVTQMLRAINGVYDPFRVVLLADGGESQKYLRAQGLDYVSGTDMRIGGEPAAYVCQNFTCNLPTTDVNKMIDLLGYK